MKVARLGIAVGAAVALLLGSVGFIGTLSPASATSTVSTTTINCGSGSATVTPATPLAAGDSLTLNYTNCNGYDLTWNAFTFTSSSPFRENGNNTEARTLTNYTGSLTGGTILATLSKTTGGSTTTINVTQASVAWTAKSPGSGVVGTAFSYQFVASGGGTYSVASGSLPNGLSISSGGLLSGTPTRIGSFTFAIAATGEASTTGNITVSVSGPVISKVTICHRTRATTNPYVLITVSVNSVIGSGGGNGHSDHNTTRTNSVNPTTNGVTPGSGPFDTSWTYASNRKWWGDIIPPFTYSTGTYAGLNWGPDWNSPNPTTATGPSSTSAWLEDSEFAAAVSATNDVYRRAAEQCMDLSTGAKSAKASAVDTPQKFFNVSVNAGEDPDDVRGDLVEQEALDSNGNSQTIPDSTTLKTTQESSAPVQTDDASNISETTGTLNGTLKSGSTWTTWKYEWGTSQSQVRDGSGSSYSYIGGTDPSSSIGSGPRNPSHIVTGLTCGTTYYFRVSGTDNATPAVVSYGSIKSFRTANCNNGGGSGGSGGNGGNGVKDPEPTAKPKPTPSSSPTSNNRPPAKLDPQSSPTTTPTPTPTSTKKANPTTPPSVNPPVTLNPGNTIPVPPGETLDPKSTKLIDPKTGTPTNTVVDDQGTWSVNSQTGSVSFTPAPGFVGTAVLRVQLSGRSGALYIQPMTVYVAARSRVLVLSGDVPKVIGAGRPGQLKIRK